MSTELVLVADGRPFKQWLSVSLVRSLERGEFSLDLSIDNVWRGDSKRAIEIGAPMQAYLDDELLMTGTIVDLYPEYDDSSHQLKIGARSPVGDLVQCSLPGRTFTKQSLVQILTSLCKPFGIAVFDNVGVTEPFKSDQVLNAGEAIWDFIENLARIRAVRLMSTPSGDLAIVRAGSASSETALVLGDNVRKASGQFSDRNRFSDYTVLASQEADEFSMGGEQTTHISGKAKDATVGRYRPLTIMSHDPATTAECRLRADWQMRTQAGRGNSIVYTVGGWQQDNSLSWRPNMLVPVQDDYKRINTEMLITETRLSMDEKGDRTEIQVMPPEAFDLVPLPEPVVESEGLF